MKIRNIIFLVGCIIILIVLVASLVGCNESFEKASPDEGGDFVDGFMIVEIGSYRIIIDKETGVEYLQYAISSCTAITPLYNADGTLKVYDKKEEE